MRSRIELPSGRCADDSDSLYEVGCYEGAAAAFSQMGRLTCVQVCCSSARKHVHSLGMCSFGVMLTCAVYGELNLCTTICDIRQSARDTMLTSIEAPGKGEYLLVHWWRSHLAHRVGHTHREWRFLCLTTCLVADMVLVLHGLIEAGWRAGIAW